MRRCNPNLHLFAGNAALPQGTALSEQTKVVSCILLVDVAEEVILEGSFTTINHLTGKFFSTLLDGYELGQGIAQLSDDIRNYVHFTASSAFIKALQGAYQRYVDFRREHFLDQK